MVHEHGHVQGGGLNKDSRVPRGRGVHVCFVHGKLRCIVSTYVSEIVSA